MSEKRFRLAEDSNGLLSIFDNEDKEDEPLIYGAMFGTEKIVDLLNEQQATIENLTKSRDKWSKSAKLHSEYFDCLEKAIEIAYEEKPYPKIEDIMTIYSKLEKEINDE